MRLRYGRRTGELKFILGSIHCTLSPGRIVLNFQVSIWSWSSWVLGALSRVLARDLRESGGDEKGLSIGLTFQCYFNETWKWNDFVLACISQCRPHVGFALNCIGLVRKSLCFLPFACHCASLLCFSVRSVFSLLLSRLLLLGLLRGLISFSALVQRVPSCRP